MSGSSLHRVGDGSRALSGLRVVPEIPKNNITEFEADERSTLDTFRRIEEGRLVIDTTGHVLESDVTARTFVGDADGLRLSNGRLFFADKAAACKYSATLEALICIDRGGACVSTCKFAVRRRSGRRPYLVSVCPISRPGSRKSETGGAKAMVLIRDPDRSAALDAELLKQSYDLSVAETCLAAALDRGSTLREIADERDVSITTVRSQLYALMAKLDINRQTDLIRLFSHYR